MPATSLVVCAPFAGRLVATEELPDPVFAQRMMGEGVALQPLTPEEGAAVEVLAPVGGRITSRWKHAVIVAPLDAPSDTGVLIHLGLDTVGVDGEGFTNLRDTGEEVASGEPVKTWDLSVAEAHGLSTATPIVLVCPAQPYPKVTVLVEVGQDVAAGQELFVVTFAG